MTALQHAFAFNTSLGGAAFHRQVTVSTRRGQRALARQAGTMLKNMALFLASPFIGLVYAVLLPFVGIGLLLWVATEGLRTSKMTGAVPEQATGARTEAPAEAAATVVTVAAAAEEPMRVGVAGAALVALKLVAAPLAGLAFIVAMPFIGLAALAWMVLRGAVLRTA